MATKDEVTDYINSIDTTTIWDDAEWSYIQQRMDPELAKQLIKLVGDVSWLVAARDNESNER
jgi:hypothetical protein|tara:strand:- start:1655 stop:1840 length:186 start_codon:yes stop_codon:yes gene_type:complete